jgi:hypothetical protein
MTRPRAPLTAEQVAERWATIREGRRRGDTWVAIAQALGLTHHGLARWMDMAAERRQTTIKPCMTCGEPIKSEGAHHRRCASCFGLDVSPYTPDPGGSTGRRVRALR